MSTNSSQPKVIRIVRKRGNAHAPHHGGSWKIAYADFVTAMMAFFMVMWILGMSEDVRRAIQAYFTDPIGYSKGYSAGASPVSSGSSPMTLPRVPLRLVTRAGQQRAFLGTAEHLREQLLRVLDGKELGLSVDVVVDRAGLRIDLYESGRGDAAFPLGSATMKPAARRAILAIADELRGLPNPITVEGHTDAVQFGGTGYGNWELSTDRANAARRVLEEGGIPPGRVSGVRGLADRQLRVPARPFDPSNRRISIFLPYQSDSGSSPAPLQRARGAEPQFTEAGS